jgi:hypothetical protein
VTGATKIIGPAPRPGCRAQQRSQYTRRPCESEERTVCRNIKTLFNFEPPATDAEIEASALQFVRKLSGFNAPSKINEAAFNRAVDEVTAAARTLIGSLVTLAPPKDRETEKVRARARSALRFGR